MIYSRERTVDEVLTSLAGKLQRNVKQVRRDIEKEITAGMRSPHKPVRERWLALGHGRRPTVEQYITYTYGLVGNDVRLPLL